MKNGDGTSFKGTPEQFVQQHSDNFRQAYQQRGFDKTYRGSINQDTYKGRIDVDRDDKNVGVIFGSDKNLAVDYGSKELFKAPHLTLGLDRKGLHEFYYPKSKNSAEIEGLGQDWANFNIGMNDEIRI